MDGIIGAIAGREVKLIQKNWTGVEINSVTGGLLLVIIKYLRSAVGG
jgi:hypothetical protein